MGDVVLLDCLDAYGLAVPTVDTSIALYVAKDQDIPKGVRTAMVLRQHCPASFIGVVPQKKIADAYKYQEQLGVRYVIGLTDGSFVVRVLADRKTETFATIDDVVAFIIATI